MGEEVRPTLPRWRFWLALAVFLSGPAALSVRVLLSPSSQATSPGNEAAKNYRRGVAALEEKDYYIAIVYLDQAIRLYREAQKDAKNQWLLASRRGVGPGPPELSDPGALREGLTWLERATEFDNRVISALTQRGLAYEGRGEHTRAVADFSLALRHGHYNPVAYSGRAKAYRALGEVAKAESDEATAKEQTDWPASTR